MEMSFKVEAENYLFSSERVPFHWDGAFYKEPSKLLFLCTESQGIGGETLFANTEKIWESLTLDEKEKAKKVTMIYRTEKKCPLRWRDQSSTCANTSRNWGHYFKSGRKS